LDTVIDLERLSDTVGVNEVVNVTEVVLVGGGVMVSEGVGTSDSVYETERDHVVVGVYVAVGGSVTVTDLVGVPIVRDGVGVSVRVPVGGRDGDIVRGWLGVADVDTDGATVREVEAANVVDRVLDTDEVGV
jgi:hypothetical protein